MPRHGPARQSSMASWAATTEPGPDCAARLPDMSVTTPILTGFANRGAAGAWA